MKRFKTKIMHTLLSAALVIAFVPTAVYAADDGHEGDLMPSIENNDAIDQEQPSLPEGTEVEEPILDEAIEEALDGSEEEPSLELQEELSSQTLEPDIIREEPEKTLALSSEVSVQAVGDTLFVDFNTGDDGAPRADGATYKTLRGAVIASEDGDTIVLLSEAKVSSTITISNKSLTVTSKDGAEPYLVSRETNFGSTFIVVDASAALTLENVIFDGGSLDGLVTEYPIMTNYGKLYLNQGSVLRNRASASSAGPILQVREAAALAEFNGGELYGGDGYGSGGALVVLDGAVVHLKRGSIHNNQVKPSTGNYGAVGGAMAIIGSSKVIMENGFEIYGNRALSGSSSFTGIGGAIYIQKSTFEMRGGEIYENSAADVGQPGYGGAIGMNGGDVILSGGTIRDNTASQWGGGIYLGGRPSTYGTSTFTMVGGAILNNEAGTDGGGVHTYNNTQSSFGTYINILGGTIADNTVVTPKTTYFSDAIYASCIFRLSTEASISGAIFLSDSRLDIPEPAKISLVSASNSTNNFLVSTDRNFDSDDGRVIVEPGSLELGGDEYAVVDAEPYVDQFLHTVKSVITGTEGGAYGIPVGSLGLGPDMLFFDLNVPAGAKETPIPSSIPAINTQIGNTIVDLPGFPAMNPVLGGFDFIGWTLDRAGTILLTDSTQVETPRTTLYAQWQAILYPITVLDDGNGVANADMDYAAEGDVVSLSAIPNEGFEFKEWQVISGGIAISGDEFTMPAQDVVVMALFEEKPLTTPETPTPTEPSEPSTPSGPTYLDTGGADTTHNAPGSEIPPTGDFALRVVLVLILLGSIGGVVMFVSHRQNASRR